MENNIVQNKRLVKNTIILYLRMFFMMALSLYTSRIVLKNLGVEDFGTYNVIGGILGMFGFITASLTTGATRFITYAIGENDESKMRVTFCGVVTIQIVLAVLIFILGETIGLWYLTEKLIIPAGREHAAFCVYQLTIIASMLNLLITPFNAEIIAHEKMGVFAYLTLLDAVLKLLIVYLLQVSSFDKLILYALLLLLVQIIDNCIYIIYCRKYFPETHGKIVIDKQLTLQLFKYSGWTMTGGITSVANNHGINLLLNLFFGPVVNAARGISTTVQMAVVNFCNNFQMALSPQIVKNVAVHDYCRVHYLVTYGTKISFSLILLISLPIIIQTDFILDVWLVEVPPNTVSLIRLILVINLVHCALANPLIFAINAVGDLKKFQIVEGLILILILPISYILYKYAILIPELAFVVYLVFEILAQIARTIIVVKKIKMSYNSYIENCLRPLVCLFLISSIVSLLLYKVCDHSFIGFILSSSLIVITVAFSFYICCCSKEERLFIRKKIFFLK